MTGHRDLLNEVGASIFNPVTRLDPRPKITMQQELLKLEKQFADWLHFRLCQEVTLLTFIA